MSPTTTPVSIPAAIAQRFQDTRRAAVRREAAAEAATLLRDQRTWTPATLHALLQHLQTDWYNGKQVRNRFSPGLTGQHEKWLLEAFDKVATWLGAVRETATRRIDDDVAARLLGDYWAANMTRMVVFPTAVLAALEPETYVAVTKPVIGALNALDRSTTYADTLDPPAYLKICRALRQICEAHGWPLCLTDAAMHVPAQSGASEAEAFTGYSGETVDFLRALAQHTADPAWHQQSRDTYNRVLREPTLALVRDIGTRYIAALDEAVAEPNRPLSILKKNDFGRDGYHTHYWFAFFDPAAAKKTESVQLYGWYSGQSGVVRYGVGVGSYGRRYHESLISALRAAPQEAADYLGRLPAGYMVRREYKDNTDELCAVEDLVKALRTNALDAFLGRERQLVELDVCQQRPLEELAERGRALVDDMGSAFVALWPLFEAARTGELKTKASPPPRPEPLDDEDAPGSLADLAIATSLSAEMLLELEEALTAKGQVILLGPPGTSKTYVAEQFARYFVSEEQGVRPQGAYRVMYMHASWAYEDFFEGIRPKIGGSGLEFAQHRGAFLSWIDDTVRKGPPGARYLLILDEINRCDTAAVLGELLQLMEYRGQHVQLLSGRSFAVPRSLYIIGTMNSADRSIGRIDLARRRRFLFLDLLPDPDALQTWLDAVPSRNPNGFDAEALRRCNAWLESEYKIPRDQQVGHALFMPSSVHGTTVDTGMRLTGATLRRIVRYSVLPYIRELLTERGRDAGPALQHAERYFSSYYDGAATGE